MTPTFEIVMMGFLSSRNSGKADFIMLLTFFIVYFDILKLTPVFVLANLSVLSNVAQLF